MNKKLTRVFIIIYIVLMIAMGIWQILDWYYGSEDPLWHLIFYIIFIPILSFIFGLSMGHHKKYFLIPILSFVTTFLVYIIFGNGGICFDVGAIKLSIIPFITTWCGIIIFKIIFFIYKKTKERKQ